jgi:hypothetical protein
MWEIDEEGRDEEGDDTGTERRDGRVAVRRDGQRKGRSREAVGGGGMVSGEGSRDEEVKRASRVVSKGGSLL